MRPSQPARKISDQALQFIGLFSFQGRYERVLTSRPPGASPAPRTRFDAGADAAHRPVCRLRRRGQPRAANYSRCPINTSSSHVKILRCLSYSGKPRSSRRASPSRDCRIGAKGKGIRGSKKLILRREVYLHQNYGQGEHSTHTATRPPSWLKREAPPWKPNAGLKPARGKQGSDDMRSRLYSKNYTIG